MSTATTQPSTRTAYLRIVALRNHASDEARRCTGTMFEASHRAKAEAFAAAMTILEQECGQ